MRIAFYVSGKANVLRQIIQKSPQDLLKNIAFVFSEDANTNYLEDLLKQNGIAYHFYEYKKFTGDKNLALSDKLLELLLENNVDYAFSTGGHILKGELLNKYKFRIVNLHPSILPQFRGIKPMLPIDRALAENVSVLGNTAHFIDEGVDTGPIIAQNVMSRKVFDKYGYRGVLDTQVDLFWLVYKWLNENRVHVNDDGVVEIDGASYDEVMYFPKILD